jgi:hypothetical protein
MAIHDATERFAPGSDLDDRALDGLRRALSARYKRRVSLTAVRPSVSSRTDELRLQRFVADAFGRRIVWYRSNDPAATEGATLGGTNDRIFVRAGTDLPAARIVGHELVHSFRRADPDAYDALQEAVAAIATSRDLYAGRIRRAYADDDRSIPSDPVIDEEFVADVVGAHFSEPGFMHQLAARMEPSPFKRFVHHALGWLEHVEARLRGRARGAFVTRHTQDAKQSRRAMLAAVARLSHHRGITSAPGDNAALRGVLDWHNAPSRAPAAAALPETRVDADAWGLLVDDYAAVESAYRDRMGRDAAMAACYPGADEFLVTGLSLAEQPAGAHNRLMQAVWTGAQPVSGIFFRGEWEQTSGADLYRLLCDGSDGSEPQARYASAILNDLGVPGLRYADFDEAPSTTGYLMFDETLFRAPPAALDHASADALRYMVAWHGSPHQFDKFSIDRIGQGEGAAAFGHGLYFAGSRSVAESYRNALTTNAVRFPDGTAQRLLTYGDFDVFESRLLGLLEDEGMNLEVDQEAVQFIYHEDTREVILEGFELAEGGGDDDLVASAFGELEALAIREPMRVQDNFDASPEAAEAVGAAYRQALDALNQLRDLGMRQAEGGLYEVEISHDDSAFLSLDERIADSQPDFAARLDIPSDIAAAKRAYDVAGKILVDAIDAEEFDHPAYEQASAVNSEAAERYTRSRMTGKDLHETLCTSARHSRPGPDDAWATYRYDGKGESREPVAMVAAYLASEGLSGIRYLDGLSRRHGEGSSNYVVFDDHLVSIRARYARPDPLHVVGQGSSIRDLEVSLAAPLARLRRHIDVVVTDRPPELYLDDADAQGVEGVCRDGKVVLFAQHLGGPEHARRILRHEAVGHIGMQRILGTDWHSIKASIHRMAHNGDPTMTHLLERTAKRYPELDPSGSDFAAEVIAGLAEQPDPHPLMTRISADFYRFMRKFHLVGPDDISIHELRDLVRQSNDAFDSEPAIDMRDIGAVSPDERLTAPDNSMSM